MRPQSSHAPSAVGSAHTSHLTVRGRHKRPRHRCCAAAGSQTLFSPSKINLFLRILRKRPDGYHDLASLFQVISFGDSLTFTEAEQDALTCNNPDVPTDSGNLVLKALDLFRRHTGSRSCFSVQLDKRVPAGAGLGGGSGNAATALWAANQAAGCPASEADLLQWAGEIGSDISVFFSLGSAYCTGRGEIVEHIEQQLPASPPLLLVKPHVGLSTPEIFRALDLRRASQQDPQRLLQGMLRHGPTQELCVNDLEQPAFDRLPQLKELKTRLQQSGSFSSVFMSGSGSTIVCAGSTQPPAWLQEAQYSHTLAVPASLIARRPGEWYTAS